MGLQKNLQNLLTCVHCTTTQHLDFQEDEVVCVACGVRYPIENGVIYISTPPNDVPMRGTKKLYKENWGEWRKSNSEHLVKSLEGVPNDARILDLGAGKSPYWEYLNTTNYPNLVSVDFGLFEHIDITANFTERVPFVDGSFDVIVFSNTLEHVPDPEFTLRECYRILQKGGILIGHTPFLHPLHDEPYDFYRYTCYALEYLLGRVGFGEISVEPLSSTNDVIHYIAHQYFVDAFSRSTHHHILRILRKMLFTTLSLTEHLIGKTYDRVQPKGYGWIGRKNS